MILYIRTRTVRLFDQLKRQENPTILTVSKIGLPDGQKQFVGSLAHIQAGPACWALSAPSDERPPHTHLLRAARNSLEPTAHNLSAGQIII